MATGNSAAALAEEADTAAGAARMQAEEVASTRALPKVELPDEAWSQTDGGALVCPEDVVDLAAEYSRVAVRQALRKAEYEALKLLVWRFRYGTHILAVSATLGTRHALYISSEEVVHREDDAGRVVSETWVSFLLRFPQWRAVEWPTDNRHADEVVRRARARVSAAESCIGFFYSSEHFVVECYTGQASSQEATSKVTSLASLATGGAAAGAAAAAPFSVTTVSVYVMGFVPWGTATVFSGGVVAAGAAVGAAAGALVAAPLYWSLQRTAQQASLRRLPLGIINETTQSLFLRVYRFDDAYCLIPMLGLGGTSEGEVGPGLLLELDPPDESADFLVVAIERGYFFNTEIMRALARRGSVYSLRSPGGSEGGAEGDTSSGREASSLTMSRIPRGVLPAYRPG